MYTITMYTITMSPEAELQLLELKTYLLEHFGNELP